MSYERDFTNDYDDWVRTQPPWEQGKPEAPQGEFAPPQFNPTPQAAIDNTPTVGAPTPPKPYDPTKDPSKPPAPFPGFEWYWTDTDGWRARPVTGTTTTGGDDGGDPMTMAGGEPMPFNWSQFSPERFSYAAYVPKNAAYTSPTLQEAENEPGYAFGRDQGRKVLENSRAGAGVLRTGGTLKDILEYGNKFATQNYAGVDQRNFRNWQAADEQDFRAYGTNRDTAFGVYDRNYRGDLDSFNATRRGEELSFADSYNRWRDKLNSLTSITTAGMNS